MQYEATSYEVDPLTCPKCNGVLTIISSLEDPAVIKRILVNIPRSIDVLGAAMLAAPVLLLLPKVLTRWGHAEEVPRLLSGLQGNPTMQTALALWDLAESGRPEVRAVFTNESLPGWTPLFLTAGALVMEIGGIMSHGAVVTGEYGIPAVVGVKDATRLFREGELLEVNGASGEVRRVLHVA